MTAADIAGYYKALVVEVGADMEGKDVRTVLERRLGVSRSLLSRLKLTEFGITVNGVRAYTTAKVFAGDQVAIRMEEEVSEDILPQELPLSIVYEDDYLLVVNKPAGIIVHPTKGHYTNTLANAIVYHWQAQGVRVRFRPVHRLDEDTSGLVVIAKNPYIHQQLSEQLQAGTIAKMYCAYVYNSPVPQDGTVDAPIDRNPEDPHVRIVTPEGYPSVTHYKSVAVYGDGKAAKVRLKLETGRTHQIRVHMKHIGCPLIGDAMYGPAMETDRVEEWEATAGRQALHAETLGLTHPMTKEWIEWTAALPPELLQLEQVLSWTK